MQIGEFDQRVAIQSFTVVVDENNQELPVWSTLASVWARVRYERADERMEADQRVAASVVKFMIRDYPVTEVMRVKWDLQYYRVLSIEEVGVNRFILIRAEWKDSRWFDILRDTGHGIREVGDDKLRAIGHSTSTI